MEEYKLMETGKHNKDFQKMWIIFNQYLIDDFPFHDALELAKKEVNK